MILASHGIIGSQITQFVGLLDDYSGAAAAYSLRKLRTAYTGSAIRVRRASDNTEQDIGFIGEDLDTSALTSFCSGTNGFVKTWYDQSGNGNDASQTTAANQPQIVSSGSVILENGKPAVDFGNNIKLNIPIAFSNTFANSTDKTFISVNKYNSVLGLRSRLLFMGLNTSTRVSMFAESGLFKGTFNGFGNTVNIVFNPLQQFLTFGTDVSTTQTFFLNNSTTGTNNLGGINNDVNVSEISNVTTGQYLDGNAQELIFYASNQSSNRTGIETNINDFYSIY